jgi:DMSO/TMAO reductase YedYZ heme-binding membrane subunit
MTPAAIQALTWDAARVGGFVAYGLVLASVVIGLMLSLKWRSTLIPRVVTNELHRFVTLLALVFTAVHGIAVAVDPFIKLNPVEVLVPFTSHYRPVWMAFGIVGFDLLVAVYLSERVRSRVGYAWWRRFHALAFVAYAFATVHGLATGSDARTPWAMGLYLGGAILVGGLLLYRLRPTDPVQRRRPVLMAGIATAILAVGAWAGTGPLASGWSAAAGGAAAPTPAAAASVPAPAAPAVGRISLPFQAALRGTASQTSGAGATLALDGRLSGAVAGRMTVTIPLADDSAVAPLTMTVDPSGATCTGEITSARQDRLGGSCTLPDGRVLAVQMRVGLDQSGALVGVVQVSGASEPTTPQQN